DALRGVAHLRVARLALLVRGPLLPQPLGQLLLARLGEVILLRFQLGLELRGGLGRALAIHLLQRVLHPLRRQYAAVIVLEDALRAAAQLAQRAQGHYSEEREHQRQRRLGEEQLAAQAHCSSSKETMCRSRSVASRKSRVKTDPKSTCLHHGCSDRPRISRDTPCVRAKSRMACAGSSDLSRTTSAPSSRAFSMLASRCRCASESI